MAKRKLDSLGNIRGHSSFANDGPRLKRLKNQLDLTVSISEINRLAADEKETKASKDTKELIDKAPAAVLKLTDKATTQSPHD